MDELDFSHIWQRIRDELQEKGIDFDAACCGPGAGEPLKVVCVAGLGDSLKEMAKTPRDQVVMVRADEETARKLDAWLETGAFKSRSEAAALFLREGLKVHARELSELAEALKGVEDAKERLREKAREVFEAAPDSEETEGGTQ